MHHEGLGAVRAEEVDALLYALSVLSRRAGGHFGGRFGGGLGALRGGLTSDADQVLVRDAVGQREIAQSLRKGKFLFEKFSELS